MFQAGFDLTMVGLDVTQKVRLTTDHVAILDKYAAPENRPIVDYLKQALPFYFRFNRLPKQLSGPLPGPRPAWPCWRRWIPVW